MSTWVTSHVHGHHSFQLKVNDGGWIEEVEVTATELWELVANLLKEFSSTIFPGSVALEVYNPASQDFKRASTLKDIAPASQIRLVPLNESGFVDYEAEKQIGARQIAIVVEYYAKHNPERPVDEVATIITTRCKRDTKCLSAQQFEQLCAQLATKYGDDPIAVHEEAVARGEGLAVDRADAALTALEGRDPQAWALPRVSVHALEELHTTTSATLDEEAVAAAAAAAAAEGGHLYGPEPGHLGLTGAGGVGGSITLTSSVPPQLHFDPSGFAKSIQVATSKLLFTMIRTDVPDIPEPSDGREHFPCCTAGEGGQCHFLCPLAGRPAQRALKTVLVVFSPKPGGDSSELNLLLPAEKAMALVDKLKPTVTDALDATVEEQRLGDKLVGGAAAAVGSVFGRRKKLSGVLPSGKKPGGVAAAAPVDRSFEGLLLTDPVAALGLKYTEVDSDVIVMYYRASGNRVQICAQLLEQKFGGPAGGAIHWPGMVAFDGLSANETAAVNQQAAAAAAGGAPAPTA